MVRDGSKSINERGNHSGHAPERYPPFCRDSSLSVKFRHLVRQSDFQFVCCQTPPAEYPNKVSYPFFASLVLQCRGLSMPSNGPSMLLQSLLRQSRDPLHSSENRDDNKRARPVEQPA